MAKNIVSYFINSKDKKLTLSQKAANYFFKFFIMMIILTFVSHIADSLTIPIVHTSRARSGKLNFNIKGTGVIEADDEEYLEIQEGLRITKIFAESGTQVKKGDPLFCFDINDIDNKCEEKKTELAKLEVSLNKTILENSKKSEESDVYEEQLANLRAEINLKEAQKQLEKANTEYDEACIKAEEKTQKEKNDNIDEKQQEYNKAVINVKKVKLDNEKEINAAERAIEDEKNKLKEIKDYIRDYDEDKEENSEPKYTKNDEKSAKDKIARAEEDLEMTRKKNDLSLKEAKNELKAAKENLEKAEGKEIDYEDDVKDEKGNIESSKKDIKTSEEGLEDNRNKLEKAYEKQKIDDYNKSIENSINNLDMEEARLNLVNLKKQISKLEDIKKNNGKVLSKYDGTISRMELEKGKYTSGQESVSVNVDNYIFKAEIEKEEAKKIKEGDSVIINVSSQKEPIETTIESIALPNEKNMVSVTAIFKEKLTLRVGEQADFTITSSSREYNQCISIDALRSDSKGKYVLVVKEKDTTLGKDLSAERVDIELIDNSYNTIAFSGQITNNDEVIVDSNRNVEEGGRVRVEEKTVNNDNKE